MLPEQVSGTVVLARAARTALARRALTAVLLALAAIRPPSGAAGRFFRPNPGAGEVLSRLTAGWDLADPAADRVGAAAVADTGWPPARAAAGDEAAAKAGVTWVSKAAARVAITAVELVRMDQNIACLQQQNAPVLGEPTLKTGAYISK
jgi:hypothetical protein